MTEIECPICLGKGEVDTGTGSEDDITLPPTSNIKGLKFWRKCKRCGGTGTVEKVPKYDD
ncbi:hypothetical protein CMO87_02225 [Candidatus Woesearchaeota archaeon]|jgi:DnaJ-class molecular chaperone|nr:hypothetical protein [Candidatus Woesearchaeota archaeon]|tara:strand:- start:656 stop:835 length:180 start_codon:yes stop_codon:yes gene_type:complete